MISLPHVKTRLCALLAASTGFDGIPILGGPIEADTGLGDFGPWEAFAKFSDATESGVDADIEKTEMCADPDRGWVETYDLVLFIQATAVGDIEHADLEVVRAAAGVSCAAACSDPTLGLAANPDPNGWVTSLEVYPAGWEEVVSGVSATEGYDLAPIVAGGFVFSVRAELDVSPTP
jgi:hypothetical protein